MRIVGQLTLYIWASASALLPAQTTQPLQPSNDPYFRKLKPVAAVNQDPANDPRSGPMPPLAPRTAESDNSPAGTKFELSEVVAIVGGQPIFVGDMLLEINQVLEKALPNAPEEVRNRERRAVIPYLISKYVDAKLLYVDVVNNLPDKLDLEAVLEQAAQDFDSNALPKILEKSNLKSAAEYDATLRSKGSSLRQMRTNWAKEQLVSYFVNQNLKYNKDIGHQELLDYYESHRQDYHVPARARWEELMVRFDRFSSREAAYKALAEMGNEVIYGARLDAVAKRSSQGVTASQGGQHDFVTRGSLADPKLEEAVFSLPLNELSDPIETKHGIHIVRVLERDVEHTRRFVDVQGEIKEALIQKNRGAAIEAYVAKIRQTIPHEIIWNGGKLPPDPNAPRR